MEFTKIVIEQPGGISLYTLKKSDVDKLEKPYERGKWYVIVEGRGSHRNAIRIKDLPQKLQPKVNMALMVMYRGY